MAASWAETQSAGQLYVHLQPHVFFHCEQKKAGKYLALAKVSSQETQIHAALKALKHKSWASLIEWCVSGRSPASLDYSEACSALNPYIIDGRGG